MSALRHSGEKSAGDDSTGSAGPDVHSVRGRDKKKKIGG